MAGVATGANTTLFGSDHGSGMLRGLFANKNSTGLFLDIGLVAALALVFRKGTGMGYWRYAAWAGIAVFPVAIILTVSRSATVLLAVIALVGIVLALARVAARGRRGRTSADARPATRLMAGAALAGAILVGVLVVSAGNERIERSLARFEMLQDGRPEIWADSLSSAKRFWPVGAGMGTFDEVFQVDESLERVRAGRAGRAHNDYLEVAIEAGLAGVAAILVFVVLHLVAFARVLRSRDRTYAVAAFGGLLCIAAQSLLDYPMRAAAMFPIAGLLLAQFWGALPNRTATR